MSATIGGDAGEYASRCLVGLQKVVDMTARQLMEVALRVLGVWFVAQAVFDTAQWAASYSFFPGTMGVTQAAFFAAAVIVGAVQLALGIALIFVASRIANRFYANEPAAEGAPSRIGLSQIGPGHLYHVASYLLGAYFLVYGIQAAAALAIRAMSSSVPADQMATPGTTAVVYIGSGLLLIFGARRIAEMLSLVRYDPDSIPQQQFSLKLLLGITVAAAVALVVLKMMTAA